MSAFKLKHLLAGTAMLAAAAGAVALKTDRTHGAKSSRSTSKAWCPSTLGNGKLTRPCAPIEVDREIQAKLWHHLQPNLVAHLCE